jgi:elongation factor Ts
MNLSLSDLKKLRNQTGARLSICQKALIEAEGNFEQAVKIVREKKEEKIIGQDAREGVVIAYSKDGRGIAIHLATETTVSAQNANFIKLAEDIASIALDKFPATKDELNALPFNDKLTVEERTVEMTRVIREKVEVKKYQRIESESVGVHIHTSTLVALVGLNKQIESGEEVGKNLAMQVCIDNPLYIDRDDIPAEKFEQEKALATERIKKKYPEIMIYEVIEKMVMGKLESFVNQNTLINGWYFNSSMLSVKDYLKSVDKDLKVTSFVRMEVEGILEPADFNSYVKNMRI